MTTYIFFWNPDVSNITKEICEERMFNTGAFTDWSVSEYENVKDGDTSYMMTYGSVNAVQWRLTLPACIYTKRLTGELTRMEPFAELQKLAEDNPGVYVNRHGDPVKLALFNLWWRESTAIAPIPED